MSVLLVAVLLCHLNVGEHFARWPVQQVATEVEVSRPMVWRWQQRFAEEGPDGLLRDRRAPGSRRSQPGRWHVSWR